MTRHLLAALLFLLTTFASSAQNRISVKEETFDDMETTAMVNTEKDRNNRDCALVVFHNVEPDGYYFDAGSVFIKAENHISRDNGEKTIFLYISEGAKLINIRHRDDGIMSLRYEFANGPLQGRHTYHVFLGKVVPANANAKQYLRFRITPSSASLEVEEQPGQYIPWVVDPATGKASKLLPLGDYAYRIRARQYHPTAGKAEMTDATTPLDEVVSLRPAFGTLEIEPVEGIAVFIDGENVSDYRRVRLDSGEHNIQISRPKYKLFATTVTIADGETTHLTPRFEANFGSVRLEASAPDVTIALREAGTDRTLGKGSWQGDLEAGTYTVISSAPGHRERVHTVAVEAGAKNLVFTLPAPTPLYGSININSTPDGAIIKLDGKERGETPAMLSNVLAGSHTLYLTARGKAPHTSTIEVRENEVSEVNVRLQDSASKPVAGNSNTPQFPRTNNFNSLPDFIKRPLGYNGPLNFDNFARPQESLTNFLKAKDRDLEKVTQKGKVTKDLIVKIGANDFVYSFYDETADGVSVSYTSNDIAKYDETVNYFAPVMTQHNAQEFACSGIADGKVSIWGKKYGTYILVCVEYHLNREKAPTPSAKQNNTPYAANRIIITGMVMEGKYPLAGVVIQSEDSKSTAVTDIDGKYSLALSSPQKVKFFFLKKSKTIAVNKSGVYNIKL